jgi:hypothetical protein
MASLEQVRAAFKTTVEAAIPNFLVHERVTAKPVPPCAQLVPTEADFAVAMARGTDTWEFDVDVLAPTADLVTGQAVIDPYITGAGSQSIRQVVFNARTLGLAGTDAHIAGLVRYGGLYEYAGGSHVGATLRLIVHTSGTE